MIERNSLENGLRVMGQRNEKGFATSTVVMVKTGSRNETPDIHGISHFLEHMNFKGTKRRPNPSDIAREVDSMGARTNAFTGIEYTGFYIQADKNHFEAGLDILSDMVFNSLIDEKELEKEKGTIIEEINMYEDTPMYLVPELFEALLFENGQMAQNILGEKEVIKKIDFRAMRRYRDKHYKAGNVIVSCAGNLPVDYVNKVEKYFGTVSAGKEDYLGKTENKLHHKNIILKKKDTEQAHLCMGVPAFGIKDERKYTADLLSVILGGNMSSRLWMEIREKRGLAYYVRSSVDACFDEGVFAVKAGLNVKKTEEAIRIVKEEMERAKKDITEEELKRAKDYTVGMMALSEENSINVAENNAVDDLLESKSLPLEERMKRYEKVTLKEVQKVAEDIFKPGELKLGIIGPYETPDKFAKILES
ncbi:MAG: pitrilysin family protein [bacterium]|nr:pitrilysin family protein [bacterium]